MVENFEIRPFEECIEKVKYTTKIASQDFKESGRFPIISQEEDFISGYWDNPEDVFHINGPVVIFGDHSRHIKYVDFDFVIGADGVKILSPVKGLNAKYFYYFLRWLDIPSMGYSRHYKALKEKSVKVFTKAYQQRIVDELDLLTGIIDKKNAQLRDLDTLAQSIFYEMFGDPETLSIKNTLGEVCSIVGRIGFRGYTRNDFVDGPEDGAISLSPANIINSEMNYDKCSYITWKKYDESPEIMINDGDILVVKTGSSYGKTALVENLPHKATINPQFVVLKQLSVDKEYLTAYLSTPFARRKYEEYVIGTAIPTFSQKKLASMPLLIPSAAEQERYSSVMSSIRNERRLIKQTLEETTSLLNSRMYFYFTD